MYRPAWRINHMGVKDVGSCLHARMNALSLSAEVSSLSFNISSQKRSDRPENDTHIYCNFA
jgi:hypothetical protein